MAITLTMMENVLENKIGLAVGLNTMFLFVGFLIKYLDIKTKNELIILANILVAIITTNIALRIYDKFIKIQDRKNEEEKIALQESTPTQSYKNVFLQWSTYGTIIDEGLDIFITKLQEKAESNEYLNKLKEQDNYEEIKEALAPNDYNMIVTPKEIDDLIENMKDVIARGINYAVQGRF